MASASPEFGAVFRALKHINAGVEAVVGLQLEDVDFASKRIELNGAYHPINAPLHAILREGIGDRTTGSVFRSPKQDSFTRDRVFHTFYELREKLGLPPELTLGHAWRFKPSNGS